jgi:hypothetical protein
MGGYYLQVLWLLGFVPVSVGTNLSWEGEEDETLRRYRGYYV